MYTTGSSQRIADLSSPLLSAGVDGMTTTRPGMCVYHDSSDWECWAADERHMPTGSRATSGTFDCPPNM